MWFGGTRSLSSEPSALRERKGEQSISVLFHENTGTAAKSPLPNAPLTLSGQLCVRSHREERGWREIQACKNGGRGEARGLDGGKLRGV